ncbi:MAG: NAD-dependent epimerase/dehydratase family protein [Anaerolineae bacterium]
MKVYVTGATGFIGTHLMHLMAQTDHELTCLVRETSDVSTLRLLGIPTVVGDVTDRASLERSIPGHDALINLANVYDFWVPDKRVYHEVNVEGTRNVLETALAADVAKVVHVSTFVIYGKPVECPFDEECEPGPVRFSEYAQSKYEGDFVAWELYEQKRLPLVLIYPGAVVGPGDPKPTGRYIANFINGRLPVTVFGESRMSFVHVRDVAKAILLALEKEGNIGEKYLVAPGAISFDEINAMISEITGVPVPKIPLPDFMVMLNARLLTALADITKKPPWRGMSVDQMRTMMEGGQVATSKVERELGLTYTPIRTAIDEAIASYQTSP